MTPNSMPSESGAPRLSRPLADADEPSREDDKPKVPRWDGVGPIDPDVVRRHESHLIGQIFHLIEANQSLETQVDRLSKATEIADILRGKGLTQGAFDIARPKLTSTSRGESAWTRIGELVERIGSEDEALKNELSEWLGVAREEAVTADPAWMADTRTKLLAAEQTIAYLDEQTRELDALRREKNSIMDGVGKLEQTIEDLWKALNEKTTHIQRLESRLSRVWESFPYRIYKTLRRPFRGRDDGQ